MMFTKKSEVMTHFVLRTPLLSLNFFDELSRSNYALDEFLFTYLDKPFIKEAIYSTSPSLYKQLEKWKTGSYFSEKKIIRLRLSLYKYLTRMSTRCTPYGLLAGCCTGNFNLKTKIVLASQEEHKVTVRNNNINNYKEPKSRDFKELFLKKEMLWYPNTSLYKIGDNWRYIETHLNLQEFEYTSEELNGDDFLNNIITFCKNGVNINELFNHLELKGITSEDSLDYLYELAYNQVLEPFDTRPLLNTEKQDFDSYTIGQDDFNIATTQNCSYDLFTTTQECQLNVSHKKDLINLANFLNKISAKKEIERLEMFKKKFTQRYGEQELPLAKVLDSEFGLNFLESNAFIGDSPLLTDLNIKRKKEDSSINLTFDKVTIVLNSKMKAAMQNNASTIELKDEDFEDVIIEEIPDTFFAFAQLGKVKGKDTLFIQNFRGGNASKIIARFGFGNSQIQGIIDDIINHEEKLLNHNQIFAEIIHQPSQKVSNVVKRFANRTYEVPYLGNSSKNMEFKINVEDLMVSIHEKRIKLKSKSLGKEVIPVLTNVHNYKNSSLPIYQFLCDVGFNHKKTSLGFSWGALKSIYSFFPRVMYKSIIISKAKWVFQITEIPIPSRKAIDSWRKREKVPQRVYLIEGDNKLLIDFQSSLSVEVFYNEIKTEKWVILEEFLFNEGTPVVDSKGDCYSNEFLLFLKKGI